MGLGVTGQRPDRGSYKGILWEGSNCRIRMIDDEAAFLKRGGRGEERVKRGE